MSNLFLNVNEIIPTIHKNDEMGKVYRLLEDIFYKTIEEMKKINKLLPKQNKIYLPSL